MNRETSLSQPVKQLIYGSCQLSDMKVYVRARARVCRAFFSAQRISFDGDPMKTRWGVSDRPRLMHIDDRAIAKPFWFFCISIFIYCSIVPSFFVLYKLQIHPRMVIKKIRKPVSNESWWRRWFLTWKYKEDIYWLETNFSTFCTRARTALADFYNNYFFVTTPLSPFRRIRS